MPRFAVRPTDLGDAAALTSGDAAALDTARRLVRTAALQAAEALGPDGGPVCSGVEGYAQVESTVADALAEACGVLSNALRTAGVGYASADAAVGFGLGGGP
jgi:hypothetical protein